MQFFGVTLARTKSLTLSPASGRGGWFSIIRESFTGAWQRNVDVSVESVIRNPTVWACATIIARDISKLWIKLVEKDEHGICTEIENSAYSPVLAEPNHYQTSVKFFEQWMLSKLLHGNTYVLKERNNRGGPGNGNVVALYILDPSRVQVLVAPDSSVFYQIGRDDLSGQNEDSVTVPASEIIHDIMYAIYHPLVGLSPIYASGLAAFHELQIQDNSSRLFENGSYPGGVLSAAGEISNEVAARLQQNWAANYGGPQNTGKIVVLGGGLTFTPLNRQTADESQLIEQLKWGDERICSTFHVPGYKVGIGPAPPYTDIQSINLEYYNRALQPEIENIERLLTKGLELPKPLGIEFDLSALLRMDTKTQVENATKGILGGLWKPNEARADFDLLPVEGGDTVYLQQQQYSLAALNARDTAPPTEGASPPAIPAASPMTDSSKDLEAALMADFVVKAAAAGFYSTAA